MSTDMPRMATPEDARAVAGPIRHAGDRDAACSTSRTTSLTTMSSMLASWARSSCSFFDSPEKGRPLFLEDSDTFSRRSAFLNRHAADRDRTPCARRRRPGAVVLVDEDADLVSARRDHFHVDAGVGGAANMRQATPVCVRMPVPTIETLLTSSSYCVRAPICGTTVSSAFKVAPRSRGP